MPARLKPLSEQVILITGASSGIGLTTARRAAQAGAKVMLVARNGDALANAVRDIEARGGMASHAVADVADTEQLKAAADATVAKFGRIDTWVNNAGVSIYGKLQEVDPADDKRLFDTNFWGVVNGSRLAVDYLKHGGAIINVGSVLSDVSVPLQGMYSASKHAVMGFTDALRMELMDAGHPISVTLIKPSAINTPYAKHAKNYLPNEPDLPAPVYAPELVADAILDAAVSPSRDVYVGGGGRVLAALGRQLPMLMDWYLAKFMPPQEQTNRPATHDGDGLHAAGPHAGQAHGDFDKDHMVRTHSVYNALMRNPAVTAGVAVAVGAAVIGLLRFMSQPAPTRSQKAAKFASAAFTGAANAAKKVVTDSLHKNRGFFN